MPPAGAHVLDPRLALVDQLVPGIFIDADTLDIGCNRGAVSVQLGMRLTRPVSVAPSRFQIQPDELKSDGALSLLGVSRLGCEDADRAAGSQHRAFNVHLFSGSI